jgi:hypothetical protein
MHRLILGMAFCAMMGAAVQAGQTYVVATDGNDNNPGSEEKPFKTIEKAGAVVKAGDTVLIRGGRYPATKLTDLNGTPDAPITFKAYPNEKPVIDRHMGEKDGVFTLHIFGHCSYLVFDGLEVTDSNPLIDELRKLDINKPADVEEFKKHLETFTYCDGVRINPPGRGVPHHHLIFRNLEIHHLMGLGFSGRGDDFQFINNHVYDLGYPRSGYGWYTSGKNHVYRGNHVHDCSYGFHLYGGPVENAVVENNIIHNCGRGFYHMSSKSVHDSGRALLLWAEGGHNVVRNNVVYDNATGITVDSPDTLVANNTIVGSAKDGIHTVADKNIVVRNNIMWKCGRNPLDLAKGNTADHNLTDKDPLFANPAKGDFHLKPGSPAISAGVAVQGVTSDMEGWLRPADEPWDLGVYQTGQTGR